MIKLYIYCSVLIIGNVEVGPDIGMKFHQEVMEIVSYDIYTAIRVRVWSFMHQVIAKATKKWYCGMYIPLSDDEHRFVQKVHLAHANGHWKCRRNSNPVVTLPHATVVLCATI